MKNDGTNGQKDADGFDAREDAALWNLLGRAPSPKAGPYFARRVLREVNLYEEARPAGAAASGSRWWQPATLWRACRLSLRRTMLLAGAPIAALLLLFLGLRMNPVGGSVTPRPAVIVSSGGNAAPDTGHLTAGNLATAEPLDDISAQDVEVIADLDTLLKREESRLWTEDDTARF